MAVKVIEITIASKNANAIFMNEEELEEHLIKTHSAHLDDCEELDTHLNQGWEIIGQDKAESQSEPSTTLSCTRKKVNK